MKKLLIALLAIGLLVSIAGSVYALPDQDPAKRLESYPVLSTGAIARSVIHEGTVIVGFSVTATSTTPVTGCLYETTNTTGPTDLEANYIDEIEVANSTTSGGSIDRFWPYSRQITNTSSYLYVQVVGTGVVTIYYEKPR